MDQKVNQAIEKYKNHDSVLRIKEQTKNLPSFGFIHVNPGEIFEQIDALNTKKASSGNIPSKVLKIAKTVICPHLTDCINTSINDCVFPEELKDATVSPVFKSKESYLKSNYRPISVLPSVSKIFERIICGQMQSYFSNILSNLLSGYRKGYSTQNALFRVIETWKQCLDSRGVVGTVLMDLSKAYDCIPHDLLIAKLEAYGLDKSSLRLMLSYLNNRIQRVKIGTCLSKYGKIKSGVPQGCVLGPLLFNIFINDMFYMNLDCNICNFADDTTLYSCRQSMDIVITEIENTLTSILSWFDQNGMVANPAKFQMMFLGKKTDTKLHLNVNGKIIPEDELVKLLGVTIDSNLTFNAHIKGICGKVNQKASALSRLRDYISEKKAKLFQNTVVMSNFQYCSLIWLFCSKAANDLINRTTKRALRITYNSNNEEALDALLQRDGTLTIHKKNLQKLMVEIYKTINHLNPPYMRDLFTKKVVEYDFRIKILCELPPARSQRFGTNSLIFKGSLLWNSLSDDTKTSQSLAIFKQKFRSWDGAHCTCNICRN